MFWLKKVMEFHEIVSLKQTLTGTHLLHFHQKKKFIQLTHDLPNHPNTFRVFIIALLPSDHSNSVLDLETRLILHNIVCYLLKVINEKKIGLLIVKTIKETLIFHLLLLMLLLPFYFYRIWNYEINKTIKIFFFTSFIEILNTIQYYLWI